MLGTVEAAKRIGVSKSTLLRWLDEGRPKAWEASRKGMFRGREWECGDSPGRSK